jgi:hypothetical protein
LGHYLAAVLHDQTQRVRDAPPGQHNKTVFVAACRLGELVGAGALDHTAASHMLQQAAAHLATGTCRCTTRELAATIASGLRTGAARPRTNLPGGRGRVA